jgi:2'-5' RNA ligase
MLMGVTSSENRGTMGSHEENMGRIAVDVVLLPDEPMTERIITANTQLVERFGGEIVLSKENCPPHISLVMGCIDERDISAIEKVLGEIAAQTSLGQLNVCSIFTSTNSTGETVSVFVVEKVPPLQKLHETVMNRLSRFFSYNVTEEMLYGDEDIAETTLDWIGNYPEKASFEHFTPHITIGYGEAEFEAFPIVFRALKLALCHLGNHCTCRKVLAAVDL